MPLEDWAYELLPTNGVTLPRKHGPRRFLVASLAIAGCIGLLWSFSYIFLPKHRYTPLDNYQNLNIMPLTHEDYARPNLPPERLAVASSLYSDSYALAVTVLGHSIRSTNFSGRLILPYIEGVSLEALCIARTAGWEPLQVPWIPPPHDGKEIYYRFVDQYSKLNVWSFDKLGVDRLVYLDADTLVRRNFDELFDMPFNFGAVPDVYSDARGFAITFNAGVLLIRPSTAVLDDMKQKIETAKYPLGQAEQAFLNLYFGPNCVRLPYAYNANLVIKQRNSDLWKALGEEMRIVHYTLVKPFINDFARTSHNIMTPDELNDTMTRAARRFDGLFAEEIGWWRDAYEDMMRVKGDEIAACLRG